MVLLLQQSIHLCNLIELHIPPTIQSLLDLHMVSFELILWTVTGIVSTCVNGIWLEVRALCVHSVYWELLNHPSMLRCNAWSHLCWFYKQHGSWFRNKDEQNIPGWLSATWEKQSCVCSMDLKISLKTFLWFLPFWSHIPSQPRIHSQVSGFSHHRCTTSEMIPLRSI